MSGSVVLKYGMYLSLLFFLLHECDALTVILRCLLEEIFILDNSVIGKKH